MAITGTKAEPAFISKYNTSPLHPPMSSVLTPLEFQTAMPWSRWNTCYRVPISDLSLNDEAQFWLDGYVNKQNCRIWSEANPQVYVETPLHPERLTVWCALWAGGPLLQKR
ncbi:hypothetical protein TNCV_316611 [Trichonephila clavipes]|nr:hypothetical protein TNCV_316611 [Trichonephila clavipes]